MNSDKRREQLADQIHEAWARWMRHVFKLSRQNADGSATIPAESVQRWKLQIDTTYSELSESEKDSDRCEADRILRLLSDIDVNEKLESEQ